MIFDNKTYDRLKYIALILLPAICTLYSTVGEVWDFPYRKQVVATISAVAVCLGSLLQISSNQYSKMLAAVETDVGEDNSKG